MKKHRARINYYSDITDYNPSFSKRNLDESFGGDAYVLELSSTEDETWSMSKIWFCKGEMIHFSLITEISKLFALGYEVTLMGESTSSE